MYPLSLFVNKEIICTKEDMMDTTALPEQFTLDIVFPPVEPRGLKNRLKTFVRMFKKWKGKIDKKTATFENGCYFGQREGIFVCEFLEIKTIAYPTLSRKQKRWLKRMAGLGAACWIFRETRTSAGFEVVGYP